MMDERTETFASRDLALAAVAAAKQAAGKGFTVEAVVSPVKAWVPGTPFDFGGEWKATFIIKAKRSKRTKGDV